ncbi:MAG: family efflux transporter [Nocardioidaceae bacterium]|nr:family efflux transporter [Nocardioidaceae bacterium]
MRVGPRSGRARPGAVAAPDTRRQILALAVPAFLALVAEPLFLLADSAIVGHLGTTQLAGLGIASAVLGSVVSLCVFLAYGTTAEVARRIGAGDPTGAVRRGLDGTWLAVLVGLAVSAVGVPAAGVVVGWFGAGPAVADSATTYLRIALLGAAPLLVMLATTGVLRGFQDTRTPLVVAVVGNALNVVLNLLLVYGVGSWSGLGIAGSALGTLVAQVASALALTAVVVRGARRHDVGLRLDPAGVRASARAGVPLLLRTLTLRISLLLMTVGAARLDHHVGGSARLATMQLALTLWTFLAFVLDAIAIAAQALTGKHLGAGDVGTTRAVTAQMQRWGLGSGVLSGLLLAGLSPVLGPLFTDDPEVHRLLVPVLLVAALVQPLAGVVFVLDGVLIGAGDGRYLAWAGFVVLLVFAPAALLAVHTGSLTALWVAFGVAFMGGRAVVLLARARGDAWLRTGPTLAR